MIMVGPDLRDAMPRPGFAATTLARGQVVIEERHQGDRAQGADHRARHHASSEGPASSTARSRSSGRARRSSATPGFRPVAEADRSGRFMGGPPRYYGGPRFVENVIVQRPPVVSTFIGLPALSFGLRRSGRFRRRGAGSCGGGGPGRPWAARCSPASAPAVRPVRRRPSVGSRVFTPVAGATEP